MSKQTDLRILMHFGTTLRTSLIGAHSRERVIAAAAPVWLPIAVALAAVGCTKPDVRPEAARRVMALGAPQSDRETAHVALFAAVLARDALTRVGGADTPQAQVITREIAHLEQVVQIPHAPSAEALDSALRVSPAFDAAGRFRGNRTMLAMHAHGLTLATDNAWSEYEQRRRAPLSALR